jgi:hypothetical protein
MINSRAVLLLMVLALGAGCAPSTRQRPISMGPVATGTGSLAEVRKQLEGAWTLSRFEVADAAGQLVEVKAKARLIYDGSGNLSITGALLEPMPGQTAIVASPALEYAGRAVIDTARQELVLVGKAAVEPDPAVVAKLGIDARRRYEFGANQLTMSALDANGRVTSKATYTR